MTCRFHDPCIKGGCSEWHVAYLERTIDCKYFKEGDAMTDETKKALEFQSLRTPPLFPEEEHTPFLLPAYPPPNVKRDGNEDHQL